MRTAFDFNTTTAMLKQYDIITIAPMMKTNFLKQMVTKAEMLSDPEIAYIYILMKIVQMVSISFIHCTAIHTR